MESNGYSGTIDVLRHLGVLVGLVLFVLIAGYLLTGSLTAGVAAIAVVAVGCYGAYTVYNLTSRHGSW